jgi:hypothetical protein
MAQDLDERGRRRWAASEALSLGRGGITAVALATGMSDGTIRNGIRELNGPIVKAGATVASCIGFDSQFLVRGLVAANGGPLTNKPYVASTASTVSQPCGARTCATDPASRRVTRGVTRASERLFRGSPFGPIVNAGATAASRIGFDLQSGSVPPAFVVSMAMNNRGVRSVLA